MVRRVGKSNEAIGTLRVWCNTRVDAAHTYDTASASLVLTMKHSSSAMSGPPFRDNFFALTMKGLKGMVGKVG